MMIHLLLDTFPTAGLLCITDSLLCIKATMGSRCTVLSSSVPIFYAHLVLLELHAPLAMVREILEPQKGAVFYSGARMPIFLRIFPVFP